MTGNIVFVGFDMANIGGPAVLPVNLALVMFTARSYLGLRIATLRSQGAGVCRRGYRSY